MDSKLTITTNKVNHKQIGKSIPKAELHIHIEGTLEPEVVVKIDKRNNTNKFPSVEELRQRFKFTCLKDFLDCCDNCLSILQTEEDFEDMMFHYLLKAKEDNIVHCEIFFALYLFNNEKIGIEKVLNGYWKGMDRGRKELNVNSDLIFCFNRGLSEESGIELLKQVHEYVKKVNDVESSNNDSTYEKRIVTVGLACAELNNPPETFKNAFKLAKELGYRLVCHCCEENGTPLDYIRQGLDDLQIERIDHGVHVWKDETLFKRVIDEKIPLTTCPISQLRLKVISDLKEFPYALFKEKGVVFSINTDDPSFFGGYLGDLFSEMGEAFDWGIEDYAQVAGNSIVSSFISDEMKKKYLGLIDEFVKSVSDNSCK